MNILLIGEYSRLHNSLKEGLEKLGHNVVILGFKDGFKDFPVDFPLEKKLNTPFLKKLNSVIYRFTGFNINSYFTYLQFKKNEKHFVGFDVVQLINENSFYCGLHYEKKILDFVFKNNRKVFLLCCGNDYLTVKYWFENPKVKSLVQPYFEGKISQEDFQNVLQYKKNDFQKLHEFIFENICGVIASDLDYHIPMQNHSKYLGLIPNPINTDILAFRPIQIHNKVIIFHGINLDNYYKKGNDFFEKALEIIKNKYQERVEIITTKSLPYQEYIQLYNKAHIILDQVYAHDQGYNALEAMAKGKVVFTGAETVFTEYYNLIEKPVVNAIPEVDTIVNEISFLIENQSEIPKIGVKARAFIEKEHDYIKIARKYLETWSKF